MIFAMFNVPRYQKIQTLHLGADHLIPGGHVFCDENCSANNEKVCSASCAKKIEKFVQ